MEPKYEVVITWSKSLGLRPTNDHSGHPGHGNPIPSSGEDYRVYEAQCLADVEFLRSCLRPGVRFSAHLVGIGDIAEETIPPDPKAKRGRKPKAHPALAPRPVVTAAVKKAQRAKTATVELAHAAPVPAG